MHWTDPATADDSPDCGDMSPLSRRDMSRAKSAVVPTHSAQPTASRFSHLLSPPKGANVCQSVNEAMRAIKKENPDLADVLPKSYHILDPACGSDGMFIQSARFVEVHHQKNPTAEISVHGLSGDIKQGNTYYEDLQDFVGRFDFVLANPPFNYSKIDKERLAGDPRYPFGIPRTDNGNYLWIQHFHSALNKKGRGGFVMANSAADARTSEQEIREKIIRAGHVDVMVAIGIIA